MTREAQVKAYLASEKEYSDSWSTSPHVSKRKSSGESPGRPHSNPCSMPTALSGFPAESCDQICRKINRLLDPGKITNGDFCRKTYIISDASMIRFRSQSGPIKGDLTGAYPAAWAYFAKRKQAGVNMPNPKKKAKTAKDRPAYADIGDNHLAGDNDDALLLYETCAEIRKKNSVYLHYREFMQAPFRRDLHVQLQGSRMVSKIQLSHLDCFRAQKGPLTGK